MSDITYAERRGEIETYFDRTAADAWTKLTSDAPVGSIRATVRAGRNQMREKLLGWLPADLTGARILDAGCGTGALAVELARRGAQVVAIDLSPKLVDVARERAPGDLGAGAIEFRSGDMLDPALGRFDHVVSMDSLIHYHTNDVCPVVAKLAARTLGSILFTFAPSTVLLQSMWTVGRLFPRSDRAPAIVPVHEIQLFRRLKREPELGSWRLCRTHRVASGFYTSQALEVVRL